MSCNDPKANYVIAAHTMDTKQIQCPDGDKDESLVGRVRVESDHGRRVHENYRWGGMCAAPLLHVGRCYDSRRGDRGMLVDSRDCDLPGWRVNARIDGVSDIHRCSPATGLVLTVPKVTYCETVAPPTPEERNIPSWLPHTSPPAG